MSNEQNFKIIYHFLLLNDIVLFGKAIDYYFICILTKFSASEKKIKEKYKQSAACVYIKNNDDSYYCIQVSLLSDNNKTNKPFKKWVLEIFRKYASNIYINLKKNSFKMIIKEINDKFLYNLYDIPNYIWCVATGMILAEI